MLKNFLKKYLNKKQKERVVRLKNRIKIISKEELEMLNTYKKEFPKVMSTTETLDIIIKNKASICRYGDAEFDICNFENENDIYQKPSKKLTKRLTEVLQIKSSDKLLICIPPFNSKYNNIQRYYGKLSFWEYYWLKRFSKLKKNFIYKEYGNSFISRDTVFYENDLEKIKKIWENSEVVFVYSKEGRFEIKGELFNNIKSYTEIFISPTNAFENYDEILEQCLNENKKKLFLIAGGPTATILAYDLSKNGYQALDIGHFPNCYDQYIGKIVSPESLPLDRKSK